MDCVWDSDPGPFRQRNAKPVELLGKRKKGEAYEDFSWNFGDPAGIRTQDPILKRDVLYQLSYWVIIVAPLFFKGGAKIDFVLINTNTIVK